uniref:Carboxylesterase type B domain-containing protein n=1 Tax=Oryzias melastigma TaxID=30732 RepID=A0A3B3D490_ORYME
CPAPFDLLANPSHRWLMLGSVLVLLVWFRSGVSERTPSVTSVSVPGHGMLKGVSVETTVGSDRRTVIQFLGVPYARPPIGMLRFEAAQPADWRGTWDASKPRCVQPGDGESSGSSEDCLYLNVFTPAARRGRVPVLVFFFNPSANESPGLLDGSALAATGNIVVVTASYRTAALGFLRASGLSGNYGLTDQEAVLRWVNAHISLMGGDNSRVTVGAEQGGADILSLHLLSRPAPLFQRMMLMVSSGRRTRTRTRAERRALDLAQELGCTTSDSTDEELLSCLRTAPVQVLNAAQTKVRPSADRGSSLLVTRDPFQFWSPVHEAVSPSSPLHRVDLLLGTSEADGLISRARRIKVRGRRRCSVVLRTLRSRDRFCSGVRGSAGSGRRQHALLPGSEPRAGRSQRKPAAEGGGGLSGPQPFSGRIQPVLQSAQQRHQVGGGRREAEVTKIRLWEREVPLLNPNIPAVTCNQGSF